MIQIGEKLPKAFKTKWLKALNSGKYKKGKAWLKQTDGEDNHYCCLGVAGELCKVTGMGDASIGYLISYDTDDYGFKGPRRLSIKGLSKVPRILKGTAEQNEIVSKLTSLNDSNKTFKQAIAWIEKNL